MNLSTGHPFALWLVPAEEQRTRLRAQIHGLADRHGTPAFDPHATLRSGVFQGDFAALRDHVNRLRSDFLPVTLRVNGVGQTDHYFTFLFVILEPREGVHLLARTVEEVVNDPLPGVGPHLSLMYSEPCDRIDRARVIEEVRPTLPEQIVFDRIEVVTPRTGNWRDVESWKTVI